MTDQRTADERGRNISDDAHQGAPELPAREPWTARGHIINARPVAKPVAKYLSNREEKTKCQGEPETDASVQAGAETESSDRAEQCLPRQRVMIVVAGLAIEFHGDRDAGANSSGQ